MQRRGDRVEYRQGGGGHKWLCLETNGRRVGIAYHDTAETMQKSLVLQKSEGLGFTEDEVQDVIDELFE